jgi:hypothetical protein
MIVRFGGEARCDEKQPQIPHCVRDDNIDFDGSIALVRGKAEAEANARTTADPSLRSG